MKIIFMGTPEFAVPALTKLINSEHEIVAVYTQPPRPSGRGMKLTKSPTHLVAEKHNIPVFHPVNFKQEEDLKQFEELGADIAVVAAYGLIVPKRILEATKYGCINIHPSSLPRWRGAAPLVRTIEAGDKTTTVCVMQMDTKLDTGDILVSKELELPSDITGGKLHDITANIGGDLVLEYLANMERYSPIKQSIDGVTYAHKILKEEAVLNFDDSIEVIERKIRAFNPWPNVHITHNNEQIKIIEADYEVTNSSNSGVIINEQFHIACKGGVLKAKVLQKAGKKPVTLLEFLNGHKFNIGDSLK